jgi:hypothetical protein
MLSKPQGLVRLEGLGKFKKLSNQRVCAEDEDNTLFRNVSELTMDYKNVTFQNVEMIFFALQVLTERDESERRT